jgi:putative flippase GtrA
LPATSPSENTISLNSPTLLGQASRFIVVGLVNTLLTGSLFYGLALLLPVWLAYTLAFALGLVFVSAITPRLVFSVRPSISRRLAYAFWYFVVYLVGLGWVAVLSDVMHVDHLRVVVFTLIVTATLSFVGGRVVLMRRPNGEGT